MWKFILDELRRALRLAAGAYALLRDQASHGVSHLIGEQIHEGIRSACIWTGCLVPGMMFSDEPGLYGHFKK